MRNGRAVVVWARVFAWGGVDTMSSSRGFYAARQALPTFPLPLLGAHVVVRFFLKMKKKCFPSTWLSLFLARLVIICEQRGSSLASDGKHF
jgi:hypothetical protein